MNELRAADWNLQRRIELEVATRVAEALVQPLAAAKARLLVHEARGEDAGLARREHDRLSTALEQHIAQARRINEELTGTPRLIAEGVSHLSAKLDHTQELQRRIDLVYAPAPAAPPPAHPAAPSATPQAPAAAAPADTAAPAPAPMTDPRDLGCRAVQAAAESGYLAQLRGLAGDDPALDETGPAPTPASPAPIVRGRGARRKPPAPRRRSAASRNRHPAPAAPVTAAPAPGPAQKAAVSWEARGVRIAAQIAQSGVVTGRPVEEQVAVAMQVAAEKLGYKVADLSATDQNELRRGVERILKPAAERP